MNTSENRRRMERALPSIFAWMEIKDERVVWKLGGFYNRKKGELVCNIRHNQGYFYCTFHSAVFNEAVLVFALHHKRLPKLNCVLDHINRTPDDNRIENLREVTQSENLMNRGDWGSGHSKLRKYKI